MSNGTIESYPQFQTGTVALKADGTVYEPPAMPPPTIEGYPPITTSGVAIDPDGVVWLYAPTQPGGIVEVTPPPVPPVNQTRPTAQIISGNPVPGQTAVCNVGTWQPPATQGYRRQWYLTGVAIPGATTNTYEIQESDVGGTLTHGVIAIGDGGESEEAISNSLTIGEAPPLDEARFDDNGGAQPRSAEPDLPRRPPTKPTTRKKR